MRYNKTMQVKKILPVAYIYTKLTDAEAINGLIVTKTDATELLNTNNIHSEDQLANGRYNSFFLSLLPCLLHLLLSNYHSFNISLLTSFFASFSSNFFHSVFNTFYYSLRCLHCFLNTSFQSLIPSSHWCFIQ